MSDQLIICTGPHGPPPGARRRGRVPLPVEGGTCHTPHTADTRQAIGLPSGGRGGLAHGLDLLSRKGWPVSSRSIFFRNSSISMVASPSFSRRRPISRSRLSSGCFFSASWPASRNAARQAASRVAGIPSSRDSRSSASPRSRRNTTSVFCRAENRAGFCHPFSDSRSNGTKNVDPLPATVFVIHKAKAFVFLCKRHPTHKARGRKPFSWIIFRAKRRNYQGITPTLCVDEALVFLHGSTVYQRCVVFCMPTDTVAEFL
jgi:hypothetical protein